MYNFYCRQILQSFIKMISIWSSFSLVVFAMRWNKHCFAVDTLFTNMNILTSSFFLFNFCYDHLFLIQTDHNVNERTVSQEKNRFQYSSLAVGAWCMMKKLYYHKLTWYKYSNLYFSFLKQKERTIGNVSMYRLQKNRKEKRNDIKKTWNRRYIRQCFKSKINWQKRTDLFRYDVSHFLFLLHIWIQSFGAVFIFILYFLFHSRCVIFFHSYSFILYVHIF